MVPPPEFAIAIKVLIIINHDFSLDGLKSALKSKFVSSLLILLSPFALGDFGIRELILWGEMTFPCIYS
jgi:hypothetical protein